MLRAFGCAWLLVLVGFGIVGCFAFVDLSDAPRDRPTGVVGEPLVVSDDSLGEVVWIVTDAEKVDRRTPEDAPSSDFNFVVVDFGFTNNSDKILRYEEEDLILLIFEDHRRNSVQAGNIRSVPDERRFFNRELEPGVTEEGRAIFAVHPDDSGFALQVPGAISLADADTGGYVDLGF